jgi:hypothetical protein
VVLTGGEQSVFALLYTIPTVLLHLCGALSYTTVAILDILSSSLFVAASVFLGRPLPRLSCAEVAQRNYGIQTFGDVTFGSNGSYPAESFGALEVGGISLPALGDTYDELLENASHYEQWIGRVGDVCRQMKGAWTGAMMLATLFAVSAAVAGKLRVKVRRLPEYDEDEFVLAVQTPRLDGAIREGSSGKEIEGGAFEAEFGDGV